MKKSKVLLLILLSMLIFCNYACDNDKDRVVTMTVASKMGKGRVELGPEGAVTPILWVKYAEHPDWQRLEISEIRGFKYEEGYEYQILVRIVELAEPPHDGSSLEFYYQKTISKVKKESENLPSDYVPPTYR